MVLARNGRDCTSKESGRPVLGSDHYPGAPGFLPVSVGCFKTVLRLREKALDGWDVTS